MVIVLMGAAGAGKTTVGRQLSEELRWLFLDGDEVHPLENIIKMGRGTPLTDEDRRPWIQALRRSIAEWLEQGMNAVRPVHCSCTRIALPSLRGMSLTSSSHTSRHHAHFYGSG